MSQELIELIIMLDSIVKIAIINIGISTPIFFLFRWLFRKFKVGERANTYFSLLGAVITPWVVLLLLFVILMSALTYYPKRDFDQSQWINSPGTRYEIADDLIERKILTGKTKSEVRQLLGNEDVKDEDYGGYRISNLEDTDKWEYFIGFKPDPMLIDASFLEIEFRDGKVINAYLVTQ